MSECFNVCLSIVWFYVSVYECSMWLYVMTVLCFVAYDCVVTNVWIKFHAGGLLRRFVSSEIKMMHRLNQAE